MDYEPTYGAVHGYLRHKMGKAKPPCQRCGATKHDRRYEWALIKGKKYEKKLENFFILCRPCHVIYDNVIQRLTENKYKPIYAIAPDKTHTFSSTKEAATEFKLLKTSINNALRGRAKTAGGYKWEYA